MTFGFIVLRHVNSELTNQYWNECVQCIRHLYPMKKIVVIDDNSKKEFIKAFYEYQNIEYIESEYPQRGELLPYYYFHKHHFFDNAIILHDSVFIHKRINFDLFNGMPVLPLWHFKQSRDENYDRIVQITKYLNYSNKFQEEFQYVRENKYLNMNIDNSSRKWNGCFGVQTYINHGFLEAAGINHRGGDQHREDSQHAAVDLREHLLDVRRQHGRQERRQQPRRERAADTEQHRCDGGDVG